MVILNAVLDHFARLQRYVLRFNAQLQEFDMTSMCVRLMSASVRVRAALVDQSATSCSEWQNRARGEMRNLFDAIDASLVHISRHVAEAKAACEAEETRVRGEPGKLEELERDFHKKVVSAFRRGCLVLHPDKIAAKRGGDSDTVTEEERLAFRLFTDAKTVLTDAKMCFACE